MSEPRTLLEAIQYFADADNCHHYMVKLRWPTGEITCPTCGDYRVRFDRKRRVYTCNVKHPRRQFSVKVGTIFEDSPLPLSKWLPTVWMIGNMKNGVSSHEVARSIGVTQKTAWFMLQRIRLAMQDDYAGGKLGGDGGVEVDETYIGGKARNMHKARKARAMKGHTAGAIGKVAVQGLLDRHGKDGHSTIRAIVVRDNSRDALEPNVHEHVPAGATVYTDAHRSYKFLQYDYMHKVVDHAERYVDGQIHTNGLENFWSLLKRAINGTYVSVEPFHLFRYLDEQAYRFNHRRMSDADRFTLAMRGILGRRVTYSELIGPTSAGSVPA